MKPANNRFLKKASGGKPPARKELKKGGLGGRGVAALVGIPEAGAAPAAAPAPAPASSVAVPGNGGIVMVPALDIERSPWQSRTDFDDGSLNDLADSIRANGIVQPPVVRRRADGKYELIAGERRTRAAILAGLKNIPVVLADADDLRAAEMGVVENIQREDLNAIEEAEGYRLLKDRFGITQENLAERVGKSRPAIANALRLLELPDEVKQLISRGLISSGHAKLLLSVEGERERILLARECAERELTVRELEKRIAKSKRPVAEPKRSVPDLPDSYVKTLADAIRDRLGCAVRLVCGATQANGRRTKGVLEVDFLDNDGLDRVLTAMGVKLD